jgi:hypothetical protein
MPAKIECTLSAEKLREMYEVQGFSTRKMSEYFGVSHPVLLNWLKEAEVKTRKFGHDRSYDEPPGKDWIWEKYWRHKLSMADIGILWAKLEGKENPYSKNVVRTWMVDSNVPRRSGSDAVSIVWARGKSKEPFFKGLQKRREQGSWTIPGTPEHMRRIVKISSRKRKGKRNSSRKCCLPECAEIVTRPNSEFRRDTWYCCISHMALHRHRLNREAAEKQEADALALKARNDARAQLGLPPEAQEA